jgi:drug/metabolite transporter (DMT)-like permease
VLAYSAPAFTAILGWRLFREKLNPFKVGVILACILGCALVAGAFNPAVWQLNPLGLTAGLISGGLFAVYNLMGKYAYQRGMNSWTTLTYAFGIATLFLLAYNLVPSLARGSGMVGDLAWLGSNLPAWGLLILLGIGPTIGGYGLYTLSLAYLPMSVASLIATLEPAFTTLLAYLLLNEQMSLPQVIGSAVILGSVLLLRLREG